MRGKGMVINMSFVIATDNTANLPMSVIREYDLKIIALPYFIDGKEYVCTNLDEFDGDAFYNMLRERVNATTSLVNPSMFHDVFEGFAKEGKDVLFIGLSSGVSGTLQSAELAAKGLKEKYPDRKIIVIDSLAASLGEGLQVLKAARLRESGKGIEEVEKIIRDGIPHVCQVLIVGDLMHLFRTGRVSGVTAFIGSKLNIKALLRGSDEGQIVSYGRAMGRKRALHALADRYAQRQVNGQEQTVGIAHCGCLKDAEYLAGLIREICEPKEIIIVTYEPVTGAHVGPDTVALFFEGTER